jgi:hypothetical protein
VAAALAAKGTRVVAAATQRVAALVAAGSCHAAHSHHLLHLLHLLLLLQAANLTRYHHLQAASGWQVAGNLAAAPALLLLLLRLRVRLLTGAHRAVLGEGGVYEHPCCRCCWRRWRCLHCSCCCCC